MNCTKNPIYKRKSTVDALDVVQRIAALHFARLLYVLKDEGFGKEKTREFCDKYDESLVYVSGDRDAVVTRYRIENLVKDAPYITYSRAVNVLDCQAGFAPRELERAYRDSNARSNLVDNIMLSMLTLHYDFGFGEKRIARVMTAWAHCNLNGAVAWAEHRTGKKIETSKKDVYDWLKSTEKKQRAATLQEQRQAKAGLEAFRRWTKETAYEEP